MADIEVLGLGLIAEPPAQEELRARVREVLGGEARVHLTLDGYDVPEATINFSGLTVADGHEHAVSNPFFTIDEAEIQTVTPGRIGRLRVIGEPITVYGCETRVHLTANEVRVNWLTLHDGSRALALATAEQFMPDLTVAARASKRELEGAVEAALEHPQGPGAVRVSRAEVHLEPHGDNGFHGTVTGKVRVGPVRVTTGVSAQITVTQHGVLTFDRVAFRGRSMLVRALGKKVLQQIPKTLDLTDSLPAGSRIEDLHVVIGKAVSLRGKVRQERGQWWFPTPRSQSSPPRQ